MYFDGPFKRQVKFSKKTGFTCEFPPAAFPLLGITQVECDTLDGCIKLWKEAVEKWKAAATETREVLIYQLHRKAHICEQGLNKDDPWRRCVFQEDDMHFEEGIGLTVCAGVFKETKIMLGKDTRYEYNLIRDRLPPSIEHGAGAHNGMIHRQGKLQTNALLTTPELEAFFTNIGLGMEKLILTLEQLKKPELVLELAARGCKLLGPPSPK